LLNSSQRLWVSSTGAIGRKDTAQP
jgi:hypothetical protein